MADQGNIQIAVDAVGASEAKSELEGVEESVEDSADSMGDASDEMEGLSQRWQGAFSAMVAGLALAAGFLLSRVPIIAELMSGFGAVLSAIGFRLDGILRPALAGFVDALFEASAVIIEADGALGLLIDSILIGIGVLLTIATVIKTLAVGWAILSGAVSTVVGVVGAVTGGMATLTSIISGLILVFKPLAVAIAGVIGGISALTAIVAIAIAAVAAFAVAYIFNIHGVRDTTNEVVGKILGWFSDLLDTLAGFLTEFAGSISDNAWRVVNAVNGVTSDITDKFTDVVSDVLEFGKDLARSFADGIRDGISFVTDAVEDMVQDARDLLPGSDAQTGPLSDLSDTGPALTDTFASGISATAGQVTQATKSVADAATPQQDGTGISPRGEQSLRVFIGGRQANQGIARYRDDNVLRRGRPQ